MIKRIVGLILAAASLAAIVLTALRCGSYTSLVTRPRPAAAHAAAPALQPQSRKADSLRMHTPQLLRDEPAAGTE